MPSLQDSAFRLFDARKTRFEVFFYFIYSFCLSLIMDLVLPVHKAFVRVKSRLPSSRCCILQICHPRCLPMVLIKWPTHNFFLVEHLQAHLSFVRQVGAKIVLPGKLFFVKPHSYKSLGFLANVNSIKRTWCFMG